MDVFRSKLKSVRVLAFFSLRPDVYLLPPTRSAYLLRRKHLQPEIRHLQRKAIEEADAAPGFSSTSASHHLSQDPTEYTKCRALPVLSASS